MKIEVYNTKQDIFRIINHYPDNELIFYLDINMSNNIVRDIHFSYWDREFIIELLASPNHRIYLLFLVLFYLLKYM